MNVELFRATISQNTKGKLRVICAQYNMTYTEIINLLILFFIENHVRLMELHAEGPEALKKYVVLREND